MRRRYSAKESKNLKRVALRSMFGEGSRRRPDGGVSGCGERRSFGSEEEQASGGRTAVLSGEEAVSICHEAQGRKDFSVNRLLPHPPSVNFNPPLPPVRGSLVQQGWVGYRQPYNQDQSPHLHPYGSQHLPTDGQRWPNPMNMQYHAVQPTFTHPSPSSPYPSTPTTPIHHLHHHEQNRGVGVGGGGTITSPGGPSPVPPPSNDSTGLNALCEAAMLSSSLPDTFPTYHNTQSHIILQPPPQPRPPPPYVNYYHPQSGPYNQGANETSPHSPLNYHHSVEHQQMTIGTKSDFTNHVSTNGTIQSDNGGGTFSFPPPLPPPPSLPAFSEDLRESTGLGHHEQKVERGNCATLQSTQLRNADTLHDQSSSSSSSYSLQPFIPPQTVPQSLEQPAGNLTSPSSSSLDKDLQHGHFSSFHPPPYLPSDQEILPAVKEEDARHSSCSSYVVDDGETPGSSLQLDQEDLEEPENQLEGSLTENRIVSDLVIATNDREDPSLDDTELPVPISQSDTASNSAISSLLFPPPPSPLPLSISQSSLRRKSKRARTAYTQAQQDALELAFHANPYPDGFFRQKVARQVGIPEDRIQVWFQNRRARGKKQSRTGSVSRRSQIREDRLKANLASIARQTAVMTVAAQRFGIAHQQQLEDLDQHQDIPLAPIQDPEQQNSEAERQSQQSESHPENHSFNSTAESSPPNHPELNSLQISSPFSILDTTSPGTTYTHNTRPISSPNQPSTVSPQPPMVVTSTDSNMPSTISYFPLPHPPSTTPHQTNSQTPSTPDSGTSDHHHLQYPTFNVHPKPLYLYPPSLGAPSLPASDHPLPSIAHLYQPNHQVANLPHPLLPPPLSTPRHASLTTRAGDRPASTPGVNVTSPVSAATADGRSLSAPSSVLTTLPSTE